MYKLLNWLFPRKSWEIIDTIEPKDLPPCDGGWTFARIYVMQCNETGEVKRMTV